MLGNRYLIV